MTRQSRKVKPGERSYLLTGIPKTLIKAAQAKAALEHDRQCGKRISAERCALHAMKPTLLRLLSDYVLHPSPAAQDAPGSTQEPNPSRNA